MRLLRAAPLALQTIPALMTAYLLGLLGAAALERHPRPPGLQPSGRLRFAIVIPAHDEQPGIEATLRGLECLNYPKDWVDVVVVADNCTDRTAELDSAAG